MPRLGRAALAYWAWVFAAGFVLGTVRTLWLAPRLGDLTAVAIELPVMLAISALAAGQVLRRHQVTRRGEALGMGAQSFVLLMIAEALLARMLGGQNLAQWAAALAAPPGALGLAGQMLLALLPWWLVRRG